MPSMLGPRGCVLWRTSLWTMGGSPFHLTLSGIWHLTSVVSWGTMFDLFESPWAPWPMVTMAHLKALSPRSKYGTWGMGKQPPIDTTKPPLKKRPTWIWFEHLLHRWVKFKLHRCWHYICSTISPISESNVWSNLHKLTARPQHTNSNRPPQKPPQKHKLKAQQKPSTPLEKTSHHKPLRKKKNIKTPPKKHHEPLRTPNFSTSFDGQHSQGTLRPLRRARYPGGLRCRSSSAAAAPRTSAEASPVGGKKLWKNQWVSHQKIQGFRNWCIDRVEKTEIRRLKWLKWEYESDWWCDLGYSSPAVSFCKNRAALPTALASLSKRDVKFGLRLEGDQKDPVSVN